MKRLLLLLCCLPALTPAQTAVSQSITGTVVDIRGSAIFGAQVKLAAEDTPQERQTTSDASGHFYFDSVAAAAFHLTISASGFSAVTLPGTLHPAEALVLPPTVLQLARLVTDVEVRLTQTEVAQEQVKAEEQQRLLGVLPNYFVTYDPHPAPLTAKQKFSLAWKTTYDPVTFGITGIIAGVEHARNTYPGYGQGAAGYGKRYAAAYGDALSGIMLSGAVFPAVFKQDPRYFYKGTGTKRSRVIYALERSVVTQGDNGKPQFSYSEILGGLASGGISNLYYPAKDRNGAALTFENAAIGIASTAVANLLQEFLFRKITTKASQSGHSKH